MITSFVLIIALLLLRLIFAKRVRRTLIYAAWALVALRLLIPVQIGHLTFSVLTSAKPVTEAITELSDKQVAGVTEQDAHRQVLQDYIEEDTSVFTPEVQAQIQSAIDKDISGEEIATIIHNDYSRADIYVPEVQQQVQQKVEETAAPITLGNILTVIWLSGVVVMVAWLATSNLLLGRALRKSEKPLACESPIPVYVSEKATSPCLAGLFRPVVYISPECASDESVFRYALIHELTHYAHKDHIWSLVRCICLCVYWFNPLVWIAAWFSRRDCELACDEGAIKRLGEEERIAYGMALLKVVSQTSASGRLMLTATTMAETKKQLHQRVKFIAKKPKWSLIAAACMMLVCILVAGCVATGPVEVGPVESTKPLEKMPWEISEEEQNKLKQDFAQYLSFADHTCTPEDVNLVVISKVESGYAVVIGCKCGGINFRSSWQDVHGQSAGDLLFYMPDGWAIKFYKDGDFLPLDAAFNKKWLTYDQLRTIWNDFHAQFPKALETWQRVFGMQEPSGRDPSGLDYVVNEDGVTCTVAGMGVCNDMDVVIPEYIDGYQVTAIGEMAFWAKRITSVVMPDSVVSIGQSAFEQCDQLRSITLSNRLEHIDTSAFMNCQSLLNITLPDSVTSIGGGAFSGCSGLTTLEIPDGVTSISAGTFSGCQNLVSVTIPAGVTSIGGGAFGNCLNLSDVTIPDGVTTLEASVFSGCRSLASVTIPANVTRIGERAFSGCSALRSINIPDGVTEIASNAFERCRSLEQIVIPDSVTTIGYWAFSDCAGMTSLTIGKGVTDIAFDALKNCSGLLHISVSQENPIYHVVNNCLIDKQSKKLLLAAKNGVIPSDGSVLHIGAYAFYGQNSLEEIVIPEGVQSIGTHAFEGCTNLRRIYIPVSMQAIDNAFALCEAMEAIYYAGTQQQWHAIRKATHLGNGLQMFTIRCTDGEIKKR